MSSGVGWILAAMLVLPSIVVAQWIRVILLFRGARHSPAPAGSAEREMQRALTAIELAAIAELEAWGFSRVREGVDDTGWEPPRTIFFAHADRLHFARLQLQADMTAGLPVMFVSFLADGRTLATINRLGWAASASGHSLDIADARADSVEAQLAFHRARATQAQPLQPEAAADRLEAAIAHDRAESLRTGRVVQGPGYTQYSFASAWRVSRALFAERRLLARPFESAATRGENAAPFLAAALALYERISPHHRTERGVKLALLTITLLASLVLWSVLFDWQFAVILLAVVLVHEGGHALAMRAFGWTNMHVFFLPMLGALATGGRPRAPAAWKDVVVLLAGPLPGLLAGLLVLGSARNADPTWHLIALTAVGINGINLLPLAPLDGGQLMAIALFNRWPRVRLAFTMLSAAGFAFLGWKLEAPVWIVFAILMARGWRREVQLAGIEAAVPDGTSGDDLILRVCDTVCARLPTLSLMQRGQLATLALRRRRIPKAGVALGLTVTLALSALWVVTAPRLASIYAPSAREDEHADRRSPAQREFDKHWVAAHYADDARTTATLEADVTRLDPEDRRRRDLAWLHTMPLPPAERASAVAAWMTQGGGHFMSTDDAAEDEVARRVAESVHRAPAERAAAMRSLVSWTAAAGPDAAAADMQARLRLAEALDLAGDEKSARQSLDEAIGFATSHDRCQCRLTPALVARAWFESSHDRPLAALRVLDGPVARSLPEPESDELAIARAWFYLQAGDPSGGLDMMRTALHADLLDADFNPPPNRGENDADAFEPWQAAELALALHEAHDDPSARKLCLGVGREACEAAAQESPGDVVADGPWRARHARERAALARAIVGQPAASKPL